VQTLAAVLGGAQSIHTTSYDEAFALPTEASHTLSIRTQQVIAYETGVTKTVDPLGGSYFVEELTDRLERDILALMEEMRGRGGYLKLFKERYIEDAIRAARFEHAEAVESGAHPIVGVNCFADEDQAPPDMDFFAVDRTMMDGRIATVKAYREGRDAAAVEAALSGVRDAAAGDDNVMDSVFAAVDAKCTLGEVGQAFREGIGHALPV
jgi:methylmalonyl-CoA mutase N-terminal domain/subunit